MRKIIGWMLLVLLVGFMGYLVYIQVRPVRFVIRDDIITISGDSMAPRLLDGKQYQIKLCKQGMCDHVFQRGDIVVYRQAPVDQEVIKRIVGLPGETVTITGGQVLINQQQLDEPYTTSGSTWLKNDQQQIQVTLGSNEFFVLGDNRGVSHDSREDGPVRSDSILAYLY